MMDPKKIFGDDGKMAEEEIRWEQISEGDWVRCAKWKRLRLVELVDYPNGQRVVYLADPDHDEAREINLNEFVKRAHSGSDQGDEETPVWLRSPVLSVLWKKAHAES